MSNSFEKEWTVMVYMSGNNNLSEEMISELKGMQAAMKSKSASKEINLVAIYHSSYFSVEPAVYRFTSENAASRLQDCKLEVEPGDLGTDRRLPGIDDFVRLVVEKAGLRAKKYGLIIAGHSDGIMGKTLLKDNSAESFVSLPRLHDMLKDAARSLGENRKFDLLGFDSCLMSMIEVGHELRDVAEIMVGSQGMIPSSGWPFDQILGAMITSNGRLTPTEFARSIVDAFGDYSRDFSLGGRSVNINASNLSEAAGLKTAVDDLGRYFGETLGGSIRTESDDADQAYAIVRERISELVHLSRYYSQSFMQEQAVDIMDFAQNLRSRSHVMRSEIRLLAGANSSPTCTFLVETLDGIGSRCERLIEAAGSYVIANSSCGPEYQFSTGCSVFFPWTYLAFNLVYESYGRLNFAKDGSTWRDFIGMYSRHTQRSSNDVSFRGETNYLTSSSPSAAAAGGQNHRAWDSRAWDSRAWDSRAWDSRAWDSRAWDSRAWDSRAWDSRAWDSRIGDLSTFVKEFGRFRNFDMYHDPFSSKK